MKRLGLLNRKECFKINQNKEKRFIKEFVKTLLEIKMGFSVLLEGLKFVSCLLIHFLFNTFSNF